MKTQPMPKQVKKSLVIFIYFALTLSTLLVFWQVRNFDFVSYDDGVYVFENQHVLNGLTADGIWWAFTTGFASFWHPLTWLSLMLDSQLFGPGPAGFHLVNLFFHIANTLLLFTVLKKMTASLWPSAFTAALFALHPLHVESVAWVAERKDVLSTFFWILTIWAYAKYAQRVAAPATAKQPRHSDGGAKWYLLVIVFFALGLMAKPMLVTLPFVFLLLDYWPLERFERRTVLYLIWEKIPFIVLVIISSIIAFFIQQSSGSILSFNNLGLRFRIGNALVSYVKYMEKMFWPSRLAVFYPYSFEDVSVLYVIISAAILLTITILIIWFTKNHRYLFTGWFWYLGTLVPVIGLVQVGTFARADRYTYITLTGLFIIIAWGLGELFAKLPRRKFILGSLTVLSLTALGTCAHRQVGFWNNSIALFSHAIEVTQDNCLAHNNLGVVYLGLGRYADAVESYTLAVKIKPDYANAYNNLGVAYSRLGRGAEAIEAYARAIKINPSYADAHYNLGVICLNLGRFEEAIDAFKQTIKIESHYDRAYNNLGAACLNLDRYTEAVEACKEAVRIKPDFAGAHNNLGIAYLKMGDKNSALAEYNILKSLDPKLANDLLSRINK